MTFHNGDPINPKEIESSIKSLYSLVRGQLGKLIPLGSNLLYSFSGGVNKVFKFRPNSIPVLYDTRTNKTSQSGQTFRNSVPFGAPWTATLGQTLGAFNLFNNQVTPSFPGVFTLDGSTTSYKKEDILPLNPPSDLVYNNQPFKGNSPFLSQGFIGFSSFVQDTNVRLFTSTDGTTLTVKAKRLSLLARAQTSSSFSVSSDAAQKVNSSRDKIESINKDSLEITVSVLADFNGTTTSGHFPAKSGVIPSGDYGVWVVSNLATAVTLIVLTPWPTTGYTKVNGVIANCSSTFLTSYSGFIYSRCVGCVYIDSDEKFKVSSTQSWGEPSTTLNADPLYGEIYQQCTSSDTTSVLQTNSTDRRIIPAYYYTDTNNPVQQGLTTYCGITKHVPGAGGNQVECWFEGYNSVTNTISGSIKVNSLELTDGTYSVWLSGLNIDSVDVPDISLRTSSTWVWEPDNSSGFATSTNGIFIWVVVDPTSVLDSISGVNIPKNNLRLKILLSPSHSWSGINATWKAANLNYTHRARIAWVPSHLPGPNTIGSRPVYNRDGAHTIMYKFGGAGSSVDSLNESDSNTSYQITSESGNWSSMVIRNLLPSNQTSPTNTGCIATEVTFKLRLIENSSASPSATNRQLFVGTTSSGALAAATATQATSIAHLLVLGNASNTVCGQISVTCPIKPTDSILYGSLLPNVGAGLEYAGIIISDYFLPFSY